MDTFPHFHVFFLYNFLYCIPIITHKQIIYNLIFKTQIIFLVIDILFVKFRINFVNSGKVFFETQIKFTVTNTVLYAEKV